jgi:hypothetical protein
MKPRCNWSIAATFTVQWSSAEREDASNVLGGEPPDRLLKRRDRPLERRLGAQIQAQPVSTPPRLPHLGPLGQPLGEGRLRRLVPAILPSPPDPDPVLEPLRAGLSRWTFRPGTDSLLRNRKAAPRSGRACPGTLGRYKNRMRAVRFQGIRQPPSAPDSGATPRPEPRAGDPESSLGTRVPRASNGRPGGTFFDPETATPRLLPPPLRALADRPRRLARLLVPGSGSPGLPRPASAPPSPRLRPASAPPTPRLRRGYGGQASVVDPRRALVAIVTRTRAERGIAQGTWSDCLALGAPTMLASAQVWEAIPGWTIPAQRFSPRRAA